MCNSAIYRAFIVILNIYISQWLSFSLLRIAQIGAIFQSLSSLSWTSVNLGAAWVLNYIVNGGAIFQMT